jgi:arylsulfatase A-like enzyme
MFENVRSFSGSARPPSFRRLAPLLFLIAVAPLVGLSCGTDRPARPNVVLIVIDTLRRDHLPFYGYAHDTAPFLSRLAGESAVFERVHSTSSWTAPATASLFTSLEPAQHGVREGFQAAQARGGGGARFRIDALPPETETVAEVMKKAGYRTFAVSDNLNVSPLAGFQQGFDRFWYSNDAGSGFVNATLREQLERIRAASPYFLYIHYMDPHRPYARRVPYYEEQGDSLADEIAAYDSEIRAVDEAIKEAFDAFGWKDGTILILTADHGEEFQDHGGWDHGRTLFSEVLDLPLLVFSSGGDIAPRRFVERVSLLDVLPTLRSWAGARPEAGDRGESLLPALRGEVPLRPDRVFFGDLLRPPWFGGETLVSLIENDRKYVRISTGGESLYDLSADPGEKRDMASEAPAFTAEARGNLDRAVREWPVFPAARPEVDLEDEQIDKLRALGYIQ